MECYFIEMSHKEAKRTREGMTLIRKDGTKRYGRFSLSPQGWGDEMIRVRKDGEVWKEF